MSIIEKIGFVAAVVLPFWNIPLVVKIIKRKSSKDISLLWVTGVWICILLMAPAGFRSSDIVWRAFNITNLVLFTIVFFVAVRFRSGNGK
ncbi:MAG: hypothetical protein P9X22_06230 [Candidatus Zapsychrus exili]|nr:hypothetical protein [Candidatus Zapsychrus exili]